jgi:drug/metabolite transporter (DMT)-like permease
VLTDKKPADKVRGLSPVLVLGLALIGISFSGPLVKLSNADPLAIATWRLLFTSLIVAVFLLATGEWREWSSLTRREFVLALGAGLALAIHFWAWMASIHMTTIAASVTLVSLQPVFVIGISAYFLHEKPTGRQYVGTGVALLGALIISLPAALGKGGFGGAAIHGDLLALLGGVAAALYYSVGRRLRSSLGIWAYVGIVYFACLASLIIFSFVMGVHLFPQPPRELGIFAGLAIGPMLFGHTGMNWALKYMPAFVVNLLVLGEPIGATLIGALLPQIAQIPPVSTMVGGAIVLAGLIVAATAKTK